MKIDLARQAKRAGKKAGTLVMLPEIVTTQSQVKDLASLYLRIVRVWQTDVNRILLPEYSKAVQRLRAKDATIRDDEAGDLLFTIQQIENSAVAAILDFSKRFLAWENAVQTWHLKQFVARLLYRTNVDLTSQMGPEDVTETMSDVLNRNISLVRSVSDETRARIADIVFRGLQQRTPVREVAKEISKATGLARARSLRIASDQTVKLSAALDKQRQIQVGMDSFIWRHSGKQHFRPEHKARNGKTYSWSSSVAKNDPPGFAPFCGCKAQGVLKID